MLSKTRRAWGDDGPKASLPRLAPGATASYHIGVRATAVGDQRVRAQVVSAEQRTATTREERTTVYKDR